MIGNLQIFFKKFRSTCNRLSAVNYREIDKFEQFFL